MKMRRYAVILAAMLMLTAAGCEKKNEETLTALRAADGVMKNNAEVPDVLSDEEEYRYEVMEEDAAADDAEAELSMDMAVGAGEAVDVMGAIPKSDADLADAPYRSDAAIEEPDSAVAPQIGVLTAGEWRDHDNWGFFSNIVNTGAVSFPSFGLDPTHRVAVEIPGAPNARVTLLDAEGAPIWNAVTDKEGRAYLFETNGRTGVSVRAVGTDGTEVTAELPAAAAPDGQGGAVLCSDRAVTLELSAEPVWYETTQIMFIVDTTGSMGDEMLYLQSDFASIAEEVGGSSTQYAALFYKDEGDSYVTRGQGFTEDVSAIKSQLAAEGADGGGDEPEAVAQALTEAFVNESWQEDAVKVAFLIYDAPPHTGKEAELNTAIETAAAKGIHLVPVVSSNGSRETELFGRAAAIMTNGSYVFLTDDSGVGGSHLEPIIGDHEVEKLHDIVVRIIKGYQQ